MLCEKAFTPDARDAEEVIMAAKAKSRSLMEAMRTRFAPLMQSTGMLLFFLSADRQGDNHLYHKYELRCPHSVESRAPTGYIIVEGSAPSMLDSFTVFSKDGCSVKLDWQGGWGSFREADAVALDIAAGRKENTVMTFA